MNVRLWGPLVQMHITHYCRSPILRVRRVPSVCDSFVVGPRVRGGGIRYRKSCSDGRMTEELTVDFSMVTPTTEEIHFRAEVGDPSVVRASYVNFRLMNVRTLSVIPSLPLPLTRAGDRGSFSTMLTFTSQDGTWTAHIPDENHS